MPIAANWDVCARRSSRVTRCGDPWLIATQGIWFLSARCACIADAVAWLDEHVGESDMPLEERERLLLDTFLPAALDHHGIDPVQPYRYVGA